MEQGIVISPRVIKCLKSMPQADQNVLLAKLTSDIVTGGSSTISLSMPQQLSYMIILDYVRRDSARMARLATA